MIFQAIPVVPLEPSTIRKKKHIVKLCVVQMRDTPRDGEKERGRERERESVRAKTSSKGNEEITRQQNQRKQMPYTPFRVYLINRHQQSRP